MAGGYPAPGPGPGAPPVPNQPGPGQTQGFGVPPGAQGTTRLGPLADEPVFYPNPNLPPHRPAYDPTRMEPRADYALHPVGRVPPDHTPLNLRPAPPPVPPPDVPADRGNLFRGLLAGAIGLVAVAALVLAFLAFANGGFGIFDDDPPPTEPAVVAGNPSDPAVAADASASAAAGTDGAAPTAPSGSATGQGVIPPATSSEPEPSAEPEATTEPAPSDANAPTAETSAAPSAPASDDAAASSEPEASGDGEVAATDTEASAGSSAQPSPSPDAGGGEVTAAIGDFLPPSDDLPAGFDAPTAEGERSLEEVAATFVGVDEDAAAAQAELEEWGWVANEFITYDAAPQPANEDINRYAVSAHEFETADGASDALPAFVEAFGVAPLDLPAEDAVGDEIFAMQTTNDDGNLAVLYVRTGQYILKIDAASVAGDPLPAALALAEQLVGSGDSEGDTSADDAGTADEGTTNEEEASEPPAV